VTNFLGINVGSGDACLPPAPGAALPSSAPRAELAPPDSELAALLASTRTVAVVGLSPRPDRTSHQIGAWLQAHTPYDLYWVNPMAAGQEVLGRFVYATLGDLPVVPDLVDIFRRSEDVPPVVEEAIAVGAKAVFMQLGIANEDAASGARAAGLDVVQNRCIKVEYDRLRTLIEAARTA
jgi:predicted CoA-binding protein